MKSRLELSVRESSPEGPFGLGIQLAVSEEDREKKVLVIRECGSLEELKREVEECKSAMDLLLSEAETVFEEHAVSPETGDVGETWEALQHAPDEETFVSRFNALGEDMRIELAEYILTTQNVFKGFACVFSKRYEEQTHTMS